MFNKFVGVFDNQLSISNKLVNDRFLLIIKTRKINWTPFQAWYYYNTMQRCAKEQTIKQS